MSNNDTTSYDEFNPSMQDWFFDELQANNTHTGGYDFNNSLNIPMDDGPPESPPPTSSNNMHAPQNSDQQSSQMQSSHSNNIYQGNGNQMDDMMPSTSDYGIQQSQIQQQHSVNQQQTQIHHQSQPQQFETLRPYNPGQIQTQNRYQGNQQMDMVFESNIDLEFMINEPTTSTAMPMECGIPQDYGQQDQQYQQQQMNPNESQWISMDNTPHHQQNQQMTVVYTSTSQSMPKIPDPGGHSNRQPQLLSYNQPPQQIIQTGPNGETILTSMQPVQQIHHPIIQPSQYDMNSNNYVHYVDQPGGSQQFISQESGNSFHQPIVQIMNPSVAGIQQQNEQTRIPPKSRAKTTKATPKKKNNPPSAAPVSGIEAMMMRMKAKMVEVRLAPEMSMRLFELLQRATDASEREKQGYDVSEEMKMYENELTQLMTKADIAPTMEPKPPPPVKLESQSQYMSQPTYILPTSAQAKKKKATKAELQQRKADAAAAAQPLPLQTPIAVNDSRIQIHAQDSNSITVNIEGKMMKAVMVSTANGTATYQILPESEQGLPMGFPSSSLGRAPPTGRQRQVIGASSVKNEADNRIMNIVTEVVDSCKGNKKGPAPRTKGKKSTDSDIESKFMTSKQIPRISEPLCVPSTSSVGSRIKSNLQAVAQLAKNVRDKREIRRKKIAEFLRKMKENLETTEINKPFTEKQDVLQRLLPYGFHLEPNLSEKAVETYENELLRHQIHNELMRQSIEKRMKNLFVREAMQTIPDVELNMLLAIDIEYERKLLENDKVKAENNQEVFIRNSEIIQSGITVDEINEAKQALALSKPKILKPHIKGGTYEPSKFDEETYRRRRQELRDQMKARRIPSSESSSSSDESSQPPSPIKEPVVKLPPPPPKKYRSPSVSSESSSKSSDESFVEKKPSKKEKKKNHNLDSPPKKLSPIRKSPLKKNDHGHRSISPIKHSKEKKEKTVLPTSVQKQKIPPTLPPGYSMLPTMKLGDYKIPKIGETPKQQTPKPAEPPKKEVITVESKDNSQKTQNVVKPFTIKLHDQNSKPINEKELEKNKSMKSDRSSSVNRPLNLVKNYDIQSRSLSESPLQREKEPIKIKIGSKGLDSSPNSMLMKVKKESEVSKKITQETSIGYSSKSESITTTAPLKLKISVGGIKTEEMTEEERRKMEKKLKKKEKKKRKKEKKERERREKEEEQRRAEKEERRKQKQIEKEAESKISNPPVNSNPPSDQKSLVLKIKMQEPQNPPSEQPKQSQNEPSAPPPLVIPKLRMKLAKPNEENREHREHKKEKKEKKKHKKEEVIEPEASEPPPMKVPRLTIKIGQNTGGSSSNISHSKNDDPPVLSYQNPSTQEQMSTNRFSPPPTLLNQSIQQPEFFNDTSVFSTGPSMSLFDSPLISRSGNNASSLSLMSNSQTRGQRSKNRNWKHFAQNPRSMNSSKSKFSNIPSSTLVGAFNNEHYSSYTCQ